MHSSGSRDDQAADEAQERERASMRAVEREAEERMPASFSLSSALALVVDLAKPLLSDRVGEEGGRFTVGDN